VAHEEAEWDIHVYKVSTRKKIGEFILSPAHFGSFHVLSDGNLLVLADKQVERWDAATSERIASRSVDRSYCRVTVSPGERYAAVWHRYPAQLEIFALGDRLRTEGMLPAVVDRSFGNGFGAFTPDGQGVLVSAAKGNVKGRSLVRYDLETGQETFAIVVPEEVAQHIIHLDWTALGDAFILNRTHMFDAKTGEAIGQTPEEYRRERPEVGVLIDRTSWLRHTMNDARQGPYYQLESFEAK
jgi:hypothetical protein